MTKAAEPGVRKEAIRITVSHGHQIHLLRLYAPAQPARAQLLVLPGLGNDSAAWLRGDTPWVKTMAQCGWDVYIADTRGKGYSLPAASPQSDWGLASLLEEEIPALVRHMRAHDAVSPWVAVAEDVSGLGLLAGLASQRIQGSGLRGLLLLQTGRAQPRGSWRYRCLQSVGRWLTGITGYVRAPWLPGPSAESRPRFFEAMAWLGQPEWRDTDDASLDQAIQSIALPRTLHLAQQSHWLPVSAVQAFMRSLPAHDAWLLHCDAEDVCHWREGLHDEPVTALVNEWFGAVTQDGQNRVAGYGQGV